MKTAAALALAALAACSSVEPPVSIAGTYELVSLNGGGLPQVVASIPPDVIQVTSGAITLNADGTYNAIERGRIVSGPPINTAVDDSSMGSGVWTLRGDSSITMEAPRETFILTLHADGSLTRFFRRSDLGGPYLDVTYRYVRQR